jgi:hypothetical protein
MYALHSHALNIHHLPAVVKRIQYLASRNALIVCACIGFFKAVLSAMHFDVTCGVLSPVCQTVSHVMQLYELRQHVCVEMPAEVILSMVQLEHTTPLLSLCFLRDSVLGDNVPIRAAAQAVMDNLD